MKIYFIGQKGIPCRSGGVEKHVEELSQRLVKYGHQVYVYTRPNYTQPKLKKYQGVNLISLPSISTKYFDAISHTWRACWHAAQSDADIIHFHSIGPSSLIWLMKLLRPDIPVLFTFHTKCYEHKKWGVWARFCLRTAERLACRTADASIAVSLSLTAYVAKKYKYLINYIPNGVSLPRLLGTQTINKEWGLKPNSYILVVSRLVGHKGLHYLIEAFNNLNTKKKLVIVGEGSYTDDYVIKLKAMAAGNKNIILTGNLTGRILEELFSNAYLFVQPSESEGLSIALLEAMSYKRAVLVSDIPENLEAARGIGAEFRSQDVKDLELKLSRLLKMPRLVKQMGEKGRERVAKRYNWSHITRSIIKLYQNELVQEEIMAQPAARFNLARKFISFLM